MLPGEVPLTPQIRPGHMNCTLAVHVTHALGDRILLRCARFGGKIVEVNLQTPTPILPPPRSASGIFDRLRQGREKVLEVIHRQTRRDNDQTQVLCRRLAQERHQRGALMRPVSTGGGFCIGSSPSRIISARNSRRFSTDGVVATQTPAAVSHRDGRSISYFSANTFFNSSFSTGITSNISAMMP